MSNATEEEEDVGDIVSEFDRICLAFGDEDAILQIGDDNDDETKTSICYFELQEHSKALAHQLYWRFRPDYVLVDCQGWPAAETVATLACMRIRRPFVPVSCMEFHQADRMKAVVDMLLRKGKSYTYACDQDKKEHGNSKTATPPSIVALTACDNDLDPILAVFQQANVHQILYLNGTSGALQEQIQVPDTIPSLVSEYNHDDMYVLFTSGTSSDTPKAVVGSRNATWHRLEWFRSTFSSSSRIGRRTKLTFVDGVNELWGSLLDYSSLLVAVTPGRLQAEGFRCLLQEPANCSQLLLLPSQLHQLFLLTSVPALERLIVSGEPCPSSLLHKFRHRFQGVQLINLYGQTETTGDCAYAILTDMLEKGEHAIFDKIVAIGKPIGSVKIELRNTDRQLVVSGEQHLSNGYLGDTTSFKYFETGDNGFYRNGNWYIQGRSNDVVKINGMWTCPAEIEAAFCKIYTNVVEEVIATFVNNKAYIICNDAETCRKFSREECHASGIPWNLVPQAAICHEIPKNSSGAGKVNRKAAKEIVKSYLDPSRAPQREQAIRTSIPKEYDTLLACVALALGGLDERQIDKKKSFVELGGDSGKSVTVLYLLQQKGITGVTAADIMMAESLQELDYVLQGVLPSKRRRKEDTHMAGKPFVPLPLVESKDKVLRSAHLAACVDATPLVVGSSVYAACQGGVILKVDKHSGKISGYRHLSGWMIQADLLAIGTSIIACAYSRDGKGLAVCLSEDLTQESWRTLFKAPIKTTPLLVMDKHLWVLAGAQIHVLLVESGKCTDSNVHLPRPVAAKPIAVKRKDEISVVYASSDWESCLMLVNDKGIVSKHLEFSIGPVHKDIATSDGQQIVLADSYGAVHHINTESMEILSTQKLSNYPLGAPLVLSDRVFVGCYDGTVFCSEGNKVLWECDCRSSIYPGLAYSEDGPFLVACTTAGDVLRIGHSGSIEWRYRLPAEIWSNPCIILPSLVSFGARDSRLHFVTMK